MPRNISGLKRGGPGRPKGVPNKVTRTMKEWAYGLMESDVWQASARKRILSGKAPHLEGHCLAVLLPKTDKHEHSGPDGQPIQVVTGVPQPGADE